MSGLRATSLKDLELEEYVDGGSSKTKFLDIFASPSGTQFPIAVGVFTLEHSDHPLQYDYVNDEGKYVVEGEITVTETKSGKVVEAKAGDILHLSAGSSTEWTTRSRAVVFYVAGRDFPLADQLEEMRVARQGDTAGQSS